MYIQVMKSKIHRVTVTDANLNYIGSITIDQDLMDAAGIIEGERGKGTICLTGAAARKVEVGDIVIIMAYAIVTPEEGREFKPSIVFPDTKTNRLIPKKK